MVKKIPCVVTPYLLINVKKKSHESVLKTAKTFFVHQTFLRDFLLTLLMVVVELRLSNQRQDKLIHTRKQSYKKS